MPPHARSIIHGDHSKAQGDCKQRAAKPKLQRHSRGYCLHSTDYMIPFAEGRLARLCSQVCTMDALGKHASANIFRHWCLGERMLTAHKEECDDGMPPDSITALMSHTPCLYLFVKTCSINASSR